MGDAFDALFSVLPIVLAVLWILRRFVGKRGKSTKSEEGDSGVRSRRVSRENARPETPPRQPYPGESRRNSSNSGNSAETGRKNKTLEAVLARVADFSEAVQHSGGIRPSGEDDLYDKDVPRRPPARTVPAARRGTEALVATDDNPFSTQPEERKGPSPLERVATLPPLAQGILWSMILDKPVGMKDPEQ